MSEQIGGLDLTPGECGLSLLQLLWNSVGESVVLYYLGRGSGAAFAAPLTK